MYKLIAIDLDGTLLNSQEKITHENKDAIKYAIEKGVKIVICSGRVYAGAKYFAGQLGLKAPLITSNGAEIMEMGTGKLLYGNYLGHEDSLKIIDICHKNNFYFHTYIGNSLYTEKIARYSLLYWERNKTIPEEERIDIRLVPDMSDVVKDSSTPVTKIVIVHDDIATLNNARKMIDEIESIDITSSNFDNFEIVSKGVNKGTALKFLAEKLGVDSKEIIAIGDNENDYPMISFAGLGVAMGNAENSIKEISDYVTLTNNQNGVAEAIKKYI